MSGFEELLGQNNLIEHLRHTVRTGKISHSYILSGDRGSGKKTLATAFSRALQCENPLEKEDGSDACGTCFSCVCCDAGSHPDIIFLQHEKPNSIGVDDIRTLRSQMQVKPYRGKYKIYLIPEAEKMTPPAQNALLKTLEEPPSYGVIILLADKKESFLPTVQSRCTVLKMQPVSETDILGYLEKNRICEGADAVYYAAFAAGSIGRAVEMAQNGALSGFCWKLPEFLKELPGMDTTGILRFLDENTEGISPEYIPELLRMWYRDIAVVKSTGTPDNLIFQREIQYIKQSTSAVSYEKIQRIQEAIFTAERRFRAHGNAELILEMLFLSVRDA